ncbi:MAG: hypothetical protein IJV50_06400 [Lachnospiraceae bacterium]|nr:hypothetical protein [Lachnospiraceae bacterium]
MKPLEMTTSVLVLLLLLVISRCGASDIRKSDSVRMDVIDNTLHSETGDIHYSSYIPESYDVFYLMHGGWSNETTTLGLPGQESAFKNILDNAIQNGDMEPLIVVCPTYNNTNENGQDSNSFSLAMQLTRNYHNELVNDLMPAAEGKYSTYAEDTTASGLAASHDHRGFGGFSMGSVTTWRTFEYYMDYFRYYLPMSCGTSLDDEAIWKGADGHDPSEYFVFMKKCSY